MLITIICPFYNEEECVKPFFTAIIKIINRLNDYDFELLCINDGSKDNTLEQLIAIQKEEWRIKIIEFSRNFGKEAALTAGLDAAQGDAVIPIDVDLQDPPELIIKMVAKWQEGFDVVLAKRSHRASDSFLKRLTANWFYRITRIIADCDIPANVGDFRLLDRMVVNAIKQLPEKRRFMKGIFAWVGFKTVTIEYTRDERVKGQSKFNAWKLWNFAIEGITSFSTIPLKAWSYIGIFISFISLIYAAFIAIRTVVFGISVPGYASLIVTILFIGGIQLIGIGIIGEYIGRIYYETKQRPVYLVRKMYTRKK